MKTSSYWLETTTRPQFGPLDRNRDVDLVVVGGGITGLTAAYLAQKAGMSVVLLERGRCATIDTGHTTAHVTCVTDERLATLRKNFGRDHARAVWDASGAAIDQIYNIIREENIACDFRWVPGYLHAPREAVTKDHVEELLAEVQAARDLNIAADYTAEIPVLGVPGVRFPHQALFHPIKYLTALVTLLSARGVSIFENTSVGEISADPLSVKAGAFTIRCRHVFVATHNPIMGKTGLIAATLFQTKLALYTTYALSAKIPAGLFPEASFWDTKDPYDYLRVERGEGHDVAVFGGEDHKTGQEPDTAGAFGRLEERFLRLVPGAEITHRWSGQVIETHDGLPYIGKTWDEQFVATGFAGNGMTFGTLGAIMAVDAFTGRKNPWRDLFSVDRKKFLSSAWDYLKENADYPYYLVRDWLRPAEARSLDEVARGEGKILHLDGRKVAAYRDTAGAVTLCSAVCTHMKGIVAWNDAEKTWDCPCHGSRFKPSGEVLSGPAEEPLEKIEPKKS